MEQIDVDDKSPDPASDTGAANLIAHWKRLLLQAGAAAARSDVTIPIPTGSLSIAGSPPVVAEESVRVSDHAEAAMTTTPPEVAVAFAVFGERTDEGRLIVAVTPAWLAIVAELARDPDAFYRLTPREFEELVAGGWRAHDWRVTLTPRSADGGRDVIATRDDVGAIRILDQVKLYKPGNLVPAKDVREMWGVLANDPRASKAYVTTSSGFAPGVEAEFADRRPFRIDFRDGTAVREWLTQALEKSGVF